MAKSEKVGFFLGHLNTGSAAVDFFARSIKMIIRKFEMEGITALLLTCNVIPTFLPLLITLHRDHSYLLAETLNIGKMWIKFNLWR